MASGISLDRKFTALEWLMFLSPKNIAEISRLTRHGFSQLEVARVAAHMIPKGAIPGVKDIAGAAYYYCGDLIPLLEEYEKGCV